MQTGELSELQAVSETQRDTLLLQISAHNDSGINQHLLIGNDGAMYRFAYGPADATATDCLLLQ